MVEIAEADNNELFSIFDELKLNLTTYKHPECVNVEVQAEHLSGLQGSLTKNLFLRDKKHGLFLITVIADRAINMKALGTMLGLSGSNLRFGDETLLMEKLGVIRGAVSPFALVNDKNNDVKFAIDSGLLESSLINTHPLRNDRTTSIPPASLLQFLERIEHSPTKILDFSNVVNTPPPAPAAKKEKKSDGSGNAEKKSNKRVAAKGETLLSLGVKKDENFSKWYTQVITLSEMIDYSDISGCYVMRPWSFFIWEQITQWFDSKIKELGVRNTYFPVFVSKKALETEKDHVEGFAPEVAWVTKSGESEMAEPIAVRPTSETVMYPFFSKWIKSHRDLPLKINQWCNVVRWEFKDATPFLRCREFLWQEGHTAHATFEEAQEMVMTILDLYSRVYEELLAVPVIKGIKTEAEKFPGGHATTTVEGYINGSGRSIQGATSHNLGQNFGKMFNITYEDDKGNSSMPWQTSWGLTIRTIGVCVMVHGDDKGLVLPPRIAPVQAIIVGIYKKGIDEDALIEYCESIKSSLETVGVRAECDTRQNYTPGWKYNHWEQKGVPIRIEIGPMDLEKKQARFVRRDTGVKEDVAKDTVASRVPELLNIIQTDMLLKARAGRDEKMVKCYEWKDFVPALNEQCLVLTPFCDEVEWEERVKEMSREEALNGETEEATCATSVAAKTLCKPFDQPPLPEGTPCFVSGKPATTWVLWGRSY